MCDGELVVSDAAEITGNGADESASKTGDGAILDGAAVSLVKRANYGEPTATIADGIFKSEQSEAVKVYGWSNSTNKVEEWNDLAEFITGGAFSGDVSGYCAEGYGTAKPAELYTVHQHQIATTTDRAATCTVAGQQTTGCTVDGCLAEKTVEPIAIDPDAHEWGEWTVARPAAPGVDGLEQSVCAHNGTHVQTRTIAALPVTQPNPPAEGSTDGGNEGGNNGAATGNPAAPVNPNAGQTPVIPATNPAPADGATIGDDATPLAANADDEAAEETIDSDETPLAAAGELQAEQGAFNWWPWIIGAAIVLLGLFFFIILARRKKDEDEEEQRA